MEVQYKLQDSAKWYAVYTKPRWEKKVAKLFLQKGIENYCPLVKVQKQWSDRKKIVFEPLIKSYVFVHIKKYENGIIRNTPGVINFVYWRGKPAVVNPDEINHLKRFLNEYVNVKVEIPLVKIEDRVRIVSGPLMMEEGRIVGIKKHTVKLILPGLNLNIIAEVNKKNIELIY